MRVSHPFAVTAAALAVAGAAFTLPLTTSDQPTRTTAATAIENASATTRGCTMKTGANSFKKTTARANCRHTGSSKSSTLVYNLQNGLAGSKTMTRVEVYGFDNHTGKGRWYKGTLVESSGAPVTVRVPWGTRTDTPKIRAWTVGSLAAGSSVKWWF